MSEVPIPLTDLLRWSEALSALARTGLGFTESLYERERFQEILHIAGEMRHTAHDHEQPATIVEDWLGTVGTGVAGYVTPKVAVAAVVSNEAGEILLTQRSDSGFWLYPVGWADVGYSPSEVALKEVWEETGIEAEVVSLIAVLDGLRLGFGGLALYSIVFHCRAVGGTLKGHPLETRDVGFFGRDNLPSPLAGAHRWLNFAFDAIDEMKPPLCEFDAPRTPPWRGDADS